MADIRNKPTLNQSDRFIEAARALECDEDEARWDENLKKIAKAPRPKKESENES